VTGVIRISYVSIEELLETAMLNNLKLSRKFNIFLLAVFLGAVVLSGVAFSAILNHNAERQVADKASLLLQTMLSVRQYTLSQINPQLSPRLETEPAFLPQTVPGYSAREVMEDLRKKPEYTDFFYKEATLNPTNLRDKADGFESEIVEQFRRNSGLKELTGYRPSPAGDLFYIARPITISQQSCLRCHSTPSAAPKSQLATYGSTSGFGWNLNETVGAQIISVPASGVIASARRSIFTFVGIMTAAFALVILVINYLLRQTVVRPLNRMAKVANEVSMGNMEANFEQSSTDEIGKLSEAFNRMKTSLVMALDMLRQGGK
jgi:HAMP domain-containing protein